MALYEVTLSGFDGGTDETDDLIKWVEAPHEEAVWELQERCEEAFDKSFEEVRDMHRQGLTFADGVDILILEKEAAPPKTASAVLEISGGRQVYVEQDQEWLGLRR